MIMINSRFYKTLIKTSPKLSNEQLNYEKYYKNVEENKIKEGKQCPYCKGEKIIKFGFFNGHQRFRCKNELCKKTFTASINNPFRYSKKFRKNYEKYFEFFIQGLPLRICAAKTGITLVTAFFWRHRFLHDLAKKNYKEKISGPYIELTQFVTLENFKGDRKFHEEKRDKIIVINALNDKIEILPIMGGRKFFGANQLRDNLIPRLDKKAYTVGFINGRLKNFCRALNVVNKVKINKEEINEIDKGYSNKIKWWLVKFKGVASKYLDHYLNWRAFEYKNSIEYTRNNSIIEKINFNINVKAEINTYLSWNKIKEKALCI